MAGAHLREEEANRSPPGPAEPAARERPEIELPVRIGRFTVLHALGAGGMGLVCAAYDAELDRKVAIKLLRPQAVSSGKSASLGQARLLREAQAMARVSHPNVVAVHEVGTFGDQVFIAMEFVAGLTLKQWLRRGRRPWREIVAVFLQAGRGLAAAHAAGLIHRDFKPDNVMISEDRGGRVERVRVFDFGVVQESREAAQRHASASLSTRTPLPDGWKTPPPDKRRDPRMTPQTEPRTRPGRLTPQTEGETRAAGEDAETSRSESLRRARARSLPLSDVAGESQEVPGVPDSASLPGDDIYSTSLTAAGALVGTPMYMAPEQYDQAADARSDQFSFCTALYEALYRRRPFAGDSAAKLQQAKRAGNIRPPIKQHGVPAWVHRVVVRGMSADPDRRFPTMEALLSALQRDRSRGPTLAIAALSAALFLFALGAGLAWSLGRHEDDPCSDAASGLAEVWDAARRDRVHAAFRGSGRPYAEPAFTAVAAALDRYAQQWAGQRVGLCRAARDPLPGGQLESRGACLEHRRHELGALVDQLARADGEVVDHAVQAAAQLSPVAACADIKALLTRAAPPLPAELAPEARALEQRLAEVRALEQTGKYGVGLEVATAAVRDARMLGHAPLVAEALYWQGVMRSKLSASRLGEVELREAATTAAESRHDEVVGRAYTELVRVVGVEQERHEEGALWAELAGPALRRVGDEAGEVVRLGYLGHLDEARGDLPAAHADYARALELARRVHGERHPQVATALDDLAGMQLRRGEYQAAEASYAEVLAIREQTQGPGHPQVAEALGHLGRAAAEQGQFPRARKLFEQALAICDSLRACGPVDRAEALVGLGRVEEAAERLPAAQVYHEEALALLEEAHGREHVKVAAELLRLGVLARRQGRFDAAAHYLERAGTILGKHYEPEHPAMSEIHGHLGLLALARGRLDEARAELERALAIHEKNDGFEGPTLAALLGDLGRVAAQQRRLGDAVALHSRARHIYRRSLDETHPDVVRTTHELGRAHLAGGDPLAAEMLLSTALVAQQQQQPAPASLADTEFLLAQALVARRGGTDVAARRQRARELAQSALTALQRVPGREVAASEIEAWLRARP